MIEVTLEGSDIRACRTHGTRADLVEVVIDVDEFGSPLGIEILELLDRYPRMAGELRLLVGEGIEISVDEDAGVIYLRLAEGRSFDQVVRLAAVAVGPDDALLGIHTRLEL